jgi:hypothetical protein
MEVDRSGLVFTDIERIRTVARNWRVTWELSMTQ